MNPRMSRSRRATLLALCLLPFVLAAAGCDRAPGPVPPEVARARQQAARGACVSTELLRRASDDVASLEETLANTSEAGPAAEVTRRAGAAALEFARAYLQHAQLRATRYSQLDSAFNYSPRPADSTRHVQAAQSLSIRAPEEGTVEANVVSAYDRAFGSLFGDPDHPCNWEE